MAKVNSLCLKTLPNLRKVDTKGLLWRSSRQDLVSLEDNTMLESMGFKTVIDFRSPGDYIRANGQKLFDQGTELKEILIASDKLKRNDPVTWPMVSKPLKNVDTGPVTKPRKRYFINFFKMNYIAAIFKRATYLQRTVSMIYLLADVILSKILWFDTHYFVKYFSSNVLGPAGLTASYIDILEMSCKQICTVLKVFSHEEYLPALMNCAHGKDRTGLVSALILHVLQKPVDYIADDYAESEEALKGVRDRLYKEIVIKYHMDESFIHCRKETMEQVFEYLTVTYGSVDNYLESIGFTTEDQERMRRIMLVEEGGSPVN